MIETLLAIAITLAIICTILALIDRHLSGKARHDSAGDLANRRGLAPRNEDDRPLPLSEIAPFHAGDNDRA